MLTAILDHFSVMASKIQPFKLAIQVLSKPFWRRTWPPHPRIHVGVKYTRKRYWFLMCDDWEKWTYVCNGNYFLQHQISPIYPFLCDLVCHAFFSQPQSLITPLSVNAMLWWTPLIHLTRERIPSDRRNVQSSAPTCFLHRHKPEYTPFMQHISFFWLFNCIPIPIVILMHECSHENDSTWHHDCTINADFESHGYSWAV